MFVFFKLEPVLEEAITITPQKKDEPPSNPVVNERGLLLNSLSV